jgi:inorganic triphosphatase YgiF
MRSLSGRELELKLDLTPQELQRVGSNPALDDLTVGKPVTMTLRSIYFDTPDHRLWARGISLRLRAIGDKWVQTVKAGPRVKYGVSNPDELEAAVARPEPDLGVIDDPRIRRTIERAVKASALEPQFETIVRRTTHKLHSDKGDLELALDEGVVRAGASEDQLCEAELELKAGSPECLLETAAVLFSAEPIRLAEASKAERGYNLALGRQGGEVVPHKAERTELSGNEMCAEALISFVQSAATQIALNRRAVLETDDPEAAHQLRVGLRRLRSALRGFRPLIDTPAARELEQYAREVGQSAGELRNADVLIESIYAPVAGVRHGEPGFAELRQALVQHRSRKRAEVRSALSGEQWSKLQLYLALWPQTVRGSTRLETPVRDFAAAALARSWKKAAKRGSRLAALAPEERHEMRKALKMLRYMAEFFGSLYPARKVDPFVKELKRLQEVFGYMNDVAMAKGLAAICDTWCADKREAHRAAGYIQGWHDVKAECIWEDVTKAWDRLAKRRRFWS